MKNQSQAYIYAILAVLCWSTVASAFKISLKYLDFLQLLLFSSLVSLVVLFFFLIGQKKIKLLKNYSIKEYLNSALLGFLNPYLYYVVLFKAYSLLKAQEAQILNYTWAIMLVLLSIPLLKQKIKVKHFSALLVSFIGVIIISTQMNLLSFRFTNLLGVSLAVGSSIVWALFWIYNSKDERDDVAKLFLNFVFGFFYICITVALFSKFSIPDIYGLIGVTYIGIFEMGVTFVLWLKAIQLAKTTASVSNLIFLSPFVSLIIIHFTVGEKILISTIIGMVLIIAGIVIQQWRE